MKEFLLVNIKSFLNIIILTSFLISCREQSVGTSALDKISTQMDEQEMNYSDFKDLNGDILEFTGRDEFVKLVNDGVLPPVEQRIPEDPIVVNPYQRTGVYCDVLNGGAISAEEGTWEIISWRQSNLVRFSDDLKTIVPAVAKGWEFFDENRTLRINLRKGHKWSNGAPFTADDIIFWWEDIVNNTELFEKIPYMWHRNGNPLELKKIDETTVEIKSDYSLKNFLIFLTGDTARPFACKEYLKKYHIKYNSEADKIAQRNGYSSWVEYFLGMVTIDWVDKITVPGVPTLDSHYLEKMPDESGRVYVANPYFHAVDISGQQLPYFYRIREKFYYSRAKLIKMFKNGEIDFKTQYLNVSDTDLYKENNNLIISFFNGKVDLNSTLAFNLNYNDEVKRKIYNDRNFRIAISHSIDREEVGDKFFGRDYILQQAVPPLDTSYMKPENSRQFIEYDPDLSNSILDELGLGRDKNGWRHLSDGRIFEIIYEYDMAILPPGLHKLIKKYWEIIGIKVLFLELPVAEIRERMRNNLHELSIKPSSHFNEIALLKDPRLIIPPFNEYYPRFGLEWEKWILTDGELGEEPPDDVKRLYVLFEQTKIFEPGTVKYKKLWKEIVEIHNNNLWLISTIGYTKRFYIHNKQLKNLPESIDSVQYSMMMPYRPYQWFMDN